MSSSLWKKMPTTWPPNGVLVWVRRVGQMVPFKATMTYGQEDLLLEDGTPIPWWCLDSWRPL